jgi:hypothetical protein
MSFVPLMILGVYHGAPSAKAGTIAMTASSVWVWGARQTTIQGRRASELPPDAVAEFQGAIAALVKRFFSRGRSSVHHLDVPPVILLLRYELVDPIGHHLHAGK